MKRNWLVFCLVVGLVMNASLVFAIDVDTSGLTEVQKAQLVLKAEELKKLAVQEAKPIVDLEEADKWVNLGKDIATVVTTTAGELGIAADKFLESTTGKMTMFFVFWKIAGKDVLGFIVGTGLLTVLLPTWFWSFRRMCVIESVEVKEPEKGFKSLREYRYQDGSKDSVIGMRVVMFVVLALILWMCLVVIF